MVLVLCWVGVNSVKSEYAKLDFAVKMAVAVSMM